MRWERCLGQSRAVLAAAAVVWALGCGGDSEPVAHADASAVDDGGALGGADARRPPGSDASPAADAAAVAGEPLFPAAGSYELSFDNGDTADVYHPTPADPSLMGATGFPVAVLLQGANVERGFYSDFATLVARYGFIVVVVDHYRSLFTMTGYYAEQSVIVDALDELAGEGSSAGSPLEGVVDSERSAVLGHSFGGAAGLNAIAGACALPFCSGGFARPDSLLAGAFYGANLRPPFGGAIPTVANDGIAVLFVQGAKDGKALPDDGLATYEAVSSTPKAYVLVDGANHYGVADQDNPPGAEADGNAPGISQAVAVESVGRWTGLFLRAHVLDDAGAADYVYELGDAVDSNVVVTGAR